MVANNDLLTEVGDFEYWGISDVIQKCAPEQRSQAIPSEWAHTQQDYRFSAPAKINADIHRAEASAISLV
jgi:hypothetical protein